MLELRQARCIPCSGKPSPLTDAEQQELLKQLPAWQIIEIEGVARLQRVFHFGNFAQALAFANDIGKLAEAADHHPALLTEWGRLTVSWWTHSCAGLQLNDFILAARCDLLSETAEGLRQN